MTHHTVPRFDLESPLFASRRVRFCFIDDVSVFIDLADGAYVQFDAVATQMWRSLIEPGSAIDRVDALAAQFEAPAETIAHDLETFASDCVRRGFAVRERPAAIAEPSSDRRPQPGHALPAWFALYRTKTLLSSTKFARLYARYGAFPRPADRPVSRDILDRTEHAFAFAENFFIMRAAPQDCLPRSLALYRFLVGCGIPSTHWIGVRTDPFAAHAWVEVAGEPFRDTAQTVAPFTKLASL